MSLSTCKPKIELLYLNRKKWNKDSRITIKQIVTAQYYFELMSNWVLSVLKLYQIGFISFKTMSN